MAHDMKLQCVINFFFFFHCNTMFENHIKCRIIIFQFWHFPLIFALLKVTCLVTVFDRKLQLLNSPKLAIFGVFKQLLSTQNVNVARFARNVECDIFLWFSTNVCELKTSWSRGVILRGFTARRHQCLMLVSWFLHGFWAEPCVSATIVQKISFSLRIQLS